MTGSIPWYVRRPQVFEREVAALHAAYPEFVRCESVHDRVVFHGRLLFRSSRGTKRIVLSLAYPDDYPLQPPRVVPLSATALAEPHDPALLEAAEQFAFRHQMADGALCLFDRGGEARDVRGVDALRRAERWLRDLLRGVLSPDLDSVDAEIAEHYPRHGFVIAGPVILDGDLPATGRLLALQVGKPEDPRYVLTHAEAREGWTDERAVLKPFVNRWTDEHLRDDYWDVATNPALLAATKYTPEVVWVGGFVTLDHEPPIVRRGADVAALLYPGATDSAAAMVAAYGVQLQSHSAIIVAMRYPERHSDRLAWLFVSLRLRPRATGQERDPQTGLVVPILDLTTTSEQRLAEAEIGVLKLQDFRRTHLQLRNAHRVPTNADTLSFSMAGVGALGSVVADLLAKSGVGGLLLYDPQMLEAGNVLRHVGSLLEVGDAKVAVVMRSVLTHNPYCTLAVDDWSVLKANPAKLFGTSAVVSTIADDPTELALNEFALDHSATVYYLRALRQGTVGRLIRVRPGSDACLNCVRLHLQDPASPLFVPRMDDEAVGHECGVPILAASGADLTAAAAIATRRILDDVSAPGPTNHWLWTTAGVAGHPHLEAPLSGVSESLAPHSACDACSGREIEAIVLPSVVATELEARARAKMPAETGGILIGRRDGRHLIVTAASDAGPHATEAPTAFVRDGAHCQAFLERAVAADATVTYLGEWHSHPNGRARPSPRDVQSLREISVDPNFRTAAPTMLIVAPAETGIERSVTIYPADRLAYPPRIVIEAP